MKTSPFFALLFFSLLHFSANAQSDKADLEKKVEAQKLEIGKLTKENDFYRDALKLINSTPVASFKEELKGFEFKISSVIGDKAANSITINGIYTNHGDPETIQGQVAMLVDPSGNQYKSYTIKLSPDGQRAEKVPTEIPMKFTIVFDKVDYTPSVSYLSLAVYGPTLKTPKIEFRALPVNWN